MWFSCLLPAFEDVSWGEGVFGLSVEVVGGGLDLLVWFPAAVVSKDLFNGRVVGLHNVGSVMGWRGVGQVGK